MKVLHLSGARSWGGNEQQLADIVPELEKLGVDNYVFGVKNSPLHKYYVDSSVIFICCKEEKLNKFKNYSYLKKIVKELKPDIIHMHTSDSVTVFTISDLLYRLKTPGVFSKKGMGNSMSILSTYKYNYKNIKKIICVSEYVKKSMEKLVMKPKNFNKLEVVFDGVNIHRSNEDSSYFNLRKEYGIASDTYLLGNIANHTKAKDLYTLIKAIHHLVYELGFNTIKCLQFGEFTSITEDLKQLLIEYKLLNHFIFVGFKSNVMSLLPQLDVFLMSSEREGGPTSVLEAFYKKVPVVSTRVGVLPDVITNGENGFLVDVYDFEEMARKIKMLLLDKELQSQFTEASFHIFNEKFHSTIVATETLNVYNKLVEL